MAVISKASKKKKLTSRGLFYLKIRSRHPSHRVLRRRKELQFDSPAVYRLGSTTEMPDRYKEINTVEAIKISANKSAMKQAFLEAKIKCAEQWTDGDLKNWAKDRYPIVAKHNFGSRNNGNTLIRTAEEFDKWLVGKTLTNYIFEKYYNFSREYRIHATQYETFYTCRKVLRNDVPEDQRWFRNDQNCNWILETNPLFDKPTNWDSICQEACKAIRAVGLDIGAVDIRVQSAKTKEGNKRKDIDFIILETNSAPSFGDITEAKYIEQLNKMLRKNDF